LFDELQDDDDIASRKEGYEVYKEMAKMDVINKALEIIADDTTGNNQDGNTIDIISDDEAVKTRLEDLFYNRLDMNNEIWNIAYDTYMMGDNFYEIQVDSLEKPKKIMALKYLEPEKTDRIEIDGKVFWQLTFYNIKQDAIEKHNVEEKELNYEYNRDVDEMMEKIPEGGSDVIQE
jgi:hypothetical protein